MKHLGDITKINGAEIEPVDCITAGSPCQDLSVAGKRAGLDGERSGLFMEQIRIIKEMREHDRQSGRTDDFTRPRYMVWENVPGAFSSNKGEDFRCVLEETAKVVQGDAVIPRPPKGKWSNSGCIVGDGWSIAWRVHDAQFWGVPQRRKRIALVADFNGYTASEILFKSKGVFGNLDEGEEKRKDAAETARGCSDSTSYTLKIRGGAERDSNGRVAGKGALIQEEKSATLGVSQDQTLVQVMSTEAYGFEPGVAQRLDPENRFYKEIAPSLRANPGDNQTSVVCGVDFYNQDVHESVEPTLGINCGISTGRNGLLIINSEVYDARGNGDGKTVPTLTGDHQNRITDYTAVVLGEDKGCSWDGGQISPTLTANNANGAQRMPDKENFNAVLTPPIECLEVGWMQALEEKSSALLARQYKDPPIINDRLRRSVARRLTPMECERLQNFPDGWTDIGEWVDSKGKKRKDADTPRYKALGNSIALPFWFVLLRRISAQYERPATLGSLFDGIGGFPLCWVRCNGIGTARWASEIEDFAIAVTRKHFGDEDLGIEGDIREYI